MRLRRFFSLSVCLVSSFLIVFFGASIKASADVFTVEKKTAADILGVIGNSLSCSYEYNGTSYSTTFNYEGIANNNNAWRGLIVDDNQVFNSVPQIQDYDFIIFSASSSVPYASFGKVRNVTIDLPLYFESYARGGFAMTAPVSTSHIDDSSNSIASYPNNYAGDFRAICGNTQASAALADYYGVVSGSLLNGNSWNWRPILYKIQSGGGFTSVHFDNVIAAYDSKLYFGIWCPYVGGSMTSSPIETTTATTTSSPSSTTEINVNINMTETNGILGSIRDLIANLGNFIVTGIKNLFIPTEEDLTAFKNTVEQLLRETFGGIPALEEQLEDAVSGLFNVTATTSIHFDGIQFDGNYYVPAQDVNLKPAGYDYFYTFVEMIINILATIAVVNTSINLVKRVVVGEVIVDVD